MSKIRLHGTSSGYVEIAPAAAASNNTLTAPSTVGEIIAKDAAGAIGVTSIVTTTATITTAKVGAAVTITESGIEASGIGITCANITCANINGGQIGGRRNLIINGAMQVAQRGTSFTASGGYTLDRWRLDDAMSAGGATITQSTTSPDGFSNSLKVDITSADTSVAAGEYAQFYQYIEAQNLQHLAYGTSAAKTVTLSFYVRSNKTGGYNLAILQSDASSRLVSFQYTINSADTWERKSFTIPGDASGQIDNDNGIGYSIFWGHAYGTNYTSGSLQSTFSGYSASNFGAGQAVNLYDSTSNEWYITGIQLELGSQATPFEHRSYQEELHLCKRYYQQYPEGPHADNYICVPSAIMACNNTTTAYYCPTLNPTMRSSPSFSHNGNFRMNGTASVNNVAVTGIGVYHNGAATPFQYATVASGLTAGQAVSLSVNNDATAYISYSSEL